MKSKNNVEAHKTRELGFKRPSTQRRTPEVIAITPRQRCVLDMLSCGYSNKQIAAMLEIAESTVKAHVSSLLKVGACTNRTQLAISILEQNLREAASDNGDRAFSTDQTKRTIQEIILVRR